MPDDIYPILNATLATILAGAETCVVPMDVDHLRGLIRLVEKFNADICEGTLPTEQRRPTFYWCDAIFSGVNSFWIVRDSARILSDAELTAWPSMTSPELVNAYRASYKKFHSDNNFEHQLICLLDLFKLQILWAAMNYR